ncbi:MAG: hypothetical protein KA369_12610 [Spirochaetes bacterium]|nr:hypothetical protein [Spirochaetota bacterium]
MKRYLLFNGNLSRLIFFSWSIGYSAAPIIACRILPHCTIFLSFHFILTPRPPLRTAERGEVKNNLVLLPFSLIRRRDRGMRSKWRWGGTMTLNVRIEEEQLLLKKTGPRADMNIDAA